MKQIKRYPVKFKPKKRKRKAKRKATLAPKAEAVKPKPKRKKKKHFNIEIEVPETFVVQADKNIRMLAGLHYATHQCSVSDMTRTDPFKTISPATLESWSIKDQWTVKRREFNEQVKRQLQGALADKVTQDRFGALSNLINIRDKLADNIMERIEELEDLTKNKPNITSMINAFVRVADFCDGLLEKVGEVVIPTVFTPDSSSEGIQQVTVKPQLSKDEALAAAKLITKMRREESRRSTASEDAEPASPNLRLIEGKQENGR